MSDRPSFLASAVGRSLEEIVAMPAEPRAAAVREAAPDLHFFFDEGRAFEVRDAPARSRARARALHDAVRAASEGGGDHAASLRERIVTDALLRAECDRDQNVYLGRLFTRTLTNAVPDVVFQPADVTEAAAALAWARAGGVPVALRGAASTAMGGAVPNDGGLALDTARLDGIEIDAKAGVAVVGAGARLRAIHAALAARGLALAVYPSNLGGTLAGWFATGGIGMNAYAHGGVLEHVLAADVLLPSGEHLRFHHDGRLDVPDAAHHRRTLAAEDAAVWFRARGLEALTLRDLAGSEGVLALVLQLTVRVVPRGPIGAFLLSFESRDAAFAAVEWIVARAGDAFPAPANLKLLSGSHLHHTRAVWADEDARAWRARPGPPDDGAGLPWTEVRGPDALGASTTPDRAHAAAYLFVDFVGLDPARRFASALPDCAGAPLALDEESVRVARERFRPQQTKRLGPGLLAAEIVLPAPEAPAFLARAERLAAGVGVALDPEIYYLADGAALVIAGYLADHRRAAFAVDLLVAPALVDLALRRHRGRPYVLGRWQAAFAVRALGRGAHDRLVALKRGLDPGAIVNPGVLLALALRGGLGALVARAFLPGIALARRLYGLPGLSALVRAARGALGGLPGPAAGRGERARVGAAFATEPVGVAPPAGAPADAARSALERPIVIGTGAAPQAASARAIHCVNCGECNSVCPIFHEAKIRLPQMLTHLGEAVHARGAVGPSGSALLDLCMRCGNCEEACQAGIPHLPLYERMQRASDAERPRDRERHVAILALLRGSPRYLRDFLGARAGGYLKRAAASLPGVARFVLLRAENDAGPAATCIHCGACVAVCPTGANREFEGDDPRWITTDQHRCIGCGTCVEVCPANHANGGRTLRVMEAPAADWFAAVEAFDKDRSERASSSPS